MTECRYFRGQFVRARDGVLAGSKLTNTRARAYGSYWPAGNLRRS